MLSAGYEDYRCNIHSGDLIEWGSNTLIGWCIRQFTGMDVNHTSLALKLEHFKHLENRRFIVEALGRGIEVNLLSKRLDKFSGTVYHLKLKPQYDRFRNDIAGWALDKLGTPYDYKNLFMQAISRVNADARQFFCSEFAYLAYCSAGLICGEQAPRPGEFTAYGLHETRVRIV